ncbi:hypothetical protein Pcinc_010863 [Petrolisthes cinctipes]|uniref:Uncharacterized protein n=1 Tax=Petrolisthes cinctipes TaxID=88211 RepID=A0AAE1KU19_PETCI|nr:hypothetical protein Pcinc_010863 [Petrolisthes cinctipes]
MRNDYGQTAAVEPETSITSFPPEEESENGNMQDKPTDEGENGDMQDKPTDEGETSEMSEPKARSTSNKPFRLVACTRIQGTRADSGELVSGRVFHNTRSTAPLSIPCVATPLHSTPLRHPRRRQRYATPRLYATHDVASDKPLHASTPPTTSPEIHHSTPLRHSRRRHQHTRHITTHNPEPTRTPLLPPLTPEELQFYAEAADTLTETIQRCQLSLPRHPYLLDHPLPYISLTLPLSTHPHPYHPTHLLHTLHHWYTLRKHSMTPYRTHNPYHHTHTLHHTQLTAHHSYLQHTHYHSPTYTLNRLHHHTTPHTTKPVHHHLPVPPFHPHHRILTLTLTCFYPPRITEPPFTHHILPPTPLPNLYPAIPPPQPSSPSYSPSLFLSHPYGTTPSFPSCAYRHPRSYTQLTYPNLSFLLHLNHSPPTVLYPTYLPHLLFLTYRPPPSPTLSQYLLLPTPHHYPVLHRLCRPSTHPHPALLPPPNPYPTPFLPHLAPLNAHLLPPTPHHYPVLHRLCRPSTHPHPALLPPPNPYPTPFLPHLAPLNAHLLPPTPHHYPVLHRQTLSPFHPPPPRSPSPTLTISNPMPTKRLPPPTPRPRLKRLPPPTPRPRLKHLPPPTPRPRLKRLPPPTPRPRLKRLPPPTPRPRLKCLPPPTPRPRLKRLPPPTPRPCLKRLPPPTPRPRLKRVPTSLSRPGLKQLPPSRQRRHHHCLATTYEYQQRCHASCTVGYSSYTNWYCAGLAAPLYPSRHPPAWLLPVTPLDLGNRALLGQLNWIATHTRPDIAFDICELSGACGKATIADLLHLNKVIVRVKMDTMRLYMPRMEKLENCFVECFSDASFANMAGSGSQGYLVKILDERSGCGRLRLKCFIDNRSLMDTLQSCKGVEDRRLRIDIALLRDMLEQREIGEVAWVDTSRQLADCLTKKGASTERLCTTVGRH